MTRSDHDNRRPSPENLLDALLATSDALLSLAARAAAQADPSLTPSQHLVLTTLAMRGPQPLTDLAAELSVEPAVAAPVCRQLEHKRLIHSVTGTGGDERLALTDGGLQMVTTMTAQVRRWLQDRTVGSGCRSSEAADPLHPANWARVSAAPSHPRNRDERRGQRQREDRSK